MARPISLSVIKLIAKDRVIPPTSTLIKLFSTSKTATMAGEHSYRLKYFNFRVIGEPIRWQFAIAGIPFDDVRLPRDTWDSEGKNRHGWGRLPILEIDGKTEISQSCAISRYLAKEFGFLPSTSLLQARADELIDNLQDLRLLWRPYVRESDASKKAIYEKEMLEIHFPFYLPKVESFIKNHGSNGYAVGDKLSWADFYLANFMQVWTENHGSELLSNFPHLEAHMNKITSIPQIKAWIQNRPQTNY